MRGTILGQYCLLKLGQIIEVVERMDDATANTVPGFDGANSPYQILEHCLGMLRSWSQADILGREIERDRDAEFTASGSVADLVQRARAAGAQFEADLAVMPPAPRSPRPRWGEEFWITSTEGVLGHVFEELAQHLGHLEITRDIIAAAD